MMVLMRQIRELSAALDRSESAAADSGTPYQTEVHEAARQLLGSVGKLTVRQVTEVIHHGAYHWVLTVTGTVAGRQMLLSDRGVIRPEDDDTRDSICDRLVTDLWRAVGADHWQPLPRPQGPVLRPPAQRPAPPCPPS